MTREQQDIALQLTQGERLPRRWGCLQWGLCLFLLVLIAGLSMPATMGVSAQARQIVGSNNCRQIQMFLKQYAADHEGRYPDTTHPQLATANDIFRHLVKEGYVEDERVFTCPISAAKADQQLGPAPHYPEAVAPGENHWAMTHGLKDGSSPDAPLIFEAPALATWPPAWNANAASKPEWGRSWRKGKIIIGRNDGSVSMEKLSTATGTQVPLQEDEKGQDLFTRYSTTGRILDVAR